MLKVLIVDDSLLARKMLGKLLEKMNYEIAGEADSGEKALIKYKSTMPDLVFMDVVMPGIGGIEASKMILAQFPDARIIIISSHLQNNLKAELLKNGLNFLLVKPIDENNLSDTIQRVLANAGSNIREDQEEGTTLRTKMQSYLKNLAKNMQDSPISEANELCDGMVVSVGHCLSRELLKATVIGGASNKVILKFDNALEKYNFHMEDPITVCFCTTGSWKICLAGVNEIIQKEKSIRVSLEKTDLLEDEAIIENFPTSMQVEFKSEFGAKKQIAIIKNIGPYSNKIVTQTELDLGEKTSFNIDLDDKVITISAEVTSKKQGVATFEYDLKTTFIDLSSKRFLKLFISQLKDKYKQA